MEKEKPYKCGHCHKRYKNLNGLKYHKQHSLPCLRALQGKQENDDGAANTAVNANAPAVGLTRIGEER